MITKCNKIKLKIKYYIYFFMTIDYSGFALYNPIFDSLIV